MSGSGLPCLACGGTTRKSFCCNRCLPLAIAFVLLVPSVLVAFGTTATVYVLLFFLSLVASSLNKQLTLTDTGSTGEVDSTRLLDR